MTTCVKGEGKGQVKADLFYPAAQLQWLCSLSSQLSAQVDRTLSLADKLQKLQKLGIDTHFHTLHISQIFAWTTTTKS